MGTRSAQISLVVRRFAALLAMVAGVWAPGRDPAGDEISPWELPPEKGIALSGCIAWQPKPHWIIEDFGTMIAALDQGRARTGFAVHAPDRRHVWYHDLDLPVDWQHYPVIAVRYRAVNTNPGSEEYLMAVTECTARGRRMRTLIAHSDVTPDGELHEVRKDLRRLDLAGPVRGLAVALIVDRYVDAPATLQVESIVFLAAEDAAPLPAVTAPGAVTVRVVDDAGRPVPRATVVIDAERLNVARAADTDAQGLARVAPIGNDTGLHMLRVEHEEGLYVPVEIGQIDVTRQDTMTIPLMPGVTFGGTVMTRSGQPVADAVVRLALTVDVLPGLRVQKQCSVITTDAGVWQTPVLPGAPRHIEMAVYHPECRVYAQPVPQGDPMMDDLKAHRAVVRLAKGSSTWEAGVHYPSVQAVLDEGTLDEIQDLAFDRTETEAVRLAVLKAVDRRLAGQPDLIAESLPFFLRLAAESDSPVLAERAMARALGCIRARDGGLTQAREIIQDACALYPGDRVVALADAGLKAWREAMAGTGAARTAGHPGLPVSPVEVTYTPARHEGASDRAPAAGVGGPGGGPAAAVAAGGIRLTGIGSRLEAVPDPIRFGRRAGPTQAPAAAAAALPRSPITLDRRMPEGAGGAVAISATPSRGDGGAAGRQPDPVPVPDRTAEDQAAGSPEPLAVASAPRPAAAAAVAVPENPAAGVGTLEAVVVACTPDGHPDLGIALPSPADPASSGAAQRQAALDALLLRPRCQAVRDLIAEGKYVEAQGQCRELLREFTLSPQSGLSVIQMAADAYAGDLGDDHAKVTAAVLREFPAEHPNRELALFYTALYWYRRGVDEMAVTQLGEFRRECPRSPMVPKSLLTEALCCIRMNQKERALATLQALTEQAPGVEEVPKAMFLIGWIHLSTQDYAKARSPLEEVVRRYPGTEFAAKAAQLLQRLPE